MKEYIISKEEYKKYFNKQIISKDELKKCKRCREKSRSRKIF